MVYRVKGIMVHIHTRMHTHHTCTQMLRHGRAGVPLEVMGLMLGEFVDDYTVRVIDVFAMPQSGTVCGDCACVCTWLVNYGGDINCVCVVSYMYMYIGMCCVSVLQSQK